MKKTVTLLMRVMFIYGVGADTASRMWNQFKLHDQRIAYGPPWNFPTPIFSLNQLEFDRYLIWERFYDDTKGGE